MSAPSLGVVGLGRMARALLLPLLEAGIVERAGVRAVVASDASAKRLSLEHCLELGLEVGTDPAQAWRAPVVILAVKPQQLEQAAEAAALAASTAEAAGEAETAGGLLISVLAGVKLGRLQALFPTWQCVRAVPNTPAMVRSGLTGLAFADSVTSEQRAWVGELFALVGEVHHLPEAQLDAFLALTSSGPAFVALVAEAMADGAVAAGLPRVLAHRLAHRTLAGTAALLAQQDLHPGQLKDMVSSPGGTTIAGLRALEKAGLRSALIEAVLAAAQRSRELA
ncbi:pyrroline-5-carboxylate reductase [Cyanobium sp. WAJ14-Wanaka]|uniref:pyrroline-5-carboxylate reductase n=1 Tax=Cyanobium sp. WAJ14-Wanaka TaxID=2823725 RepID=UPI0020CE9DCE|nr:pyrroline-5-carboxylate reductase [Cyanobium sp. WAJ14-Wanaka]